MDSEKSKLALTQFFSSLFHNFPKLLLTNLLFAVPFAVFFGIFWLINNLSGLHTNFILFLTVIPLFPFYAGVTQVIAHIVRGEKDISVWQDFLLGIKENFLRFLVHGVILYAAIFFSYYSITMYISLGKSNSFFYFFLAISIIVSIFFMFAFYYIPSMTVTFDLSMKNIYKNSALMTFGEFKHNIFATFGLFVLALVCATILFCCGNAIVLIIVTILLMLFILPSIISFIINSAVYNSMYQVIVGKDKKSKEIDKKIENRKKGQFYDDEPENNVPPEDFNNIEIDETKDGDEYIFYNGKMIKRSVLIKLRQQTQKKEND